MNAVRFILVCAIRLYQAVISPLLHGVLGPMGGCRFHPTCSAYAVEAIERHGAIRGAWLACVRLCRCHPWGSSGDDPVPELAGRIPPAPRRTAGPAAAGAVIAR